MLTTQTNSVFSKASKAFVDLIEGIVKPQYVAGFVYSLFNNPVFPLEPLYLKDSLISYYPRSVELFNSESKEIIITSEEAIYINEKLFDAKLQEKYNEVFQALDMFHRHFNGAIDAENLIGFYSSCLTTLNSDGGAFTFYNFNSLNGLNINYFKNQATLKFHDLKEAINEKICSLQTVIVETYPSNVFTQPEYYNKFKRYQAKYIDNPYNDYSFLFKRMNDLNMMHRLTFKDATDWLYSQGYIDKQTSDDFYLKGSFNTKAKSKDREQKFNNVFENE